MLVQARVQHSLKRCETDGLREAERSRRAPLFLTAWLSSSRPASKVKLLQRAESGLAARRRRSVASRRSQTDCPPHPYRRVGVVEVRRDETHATMPAYESTPRCCVAQSCLTLSLQSTKGIRPCPSSPSKLKEMHLIRGGACIPCFVPPETIHIRLFSRIGTSVFSPSIGHKSISTTASAYS